jgi:hypothetical protein
MFLSGIFSGFRPRLLKHWGSWLAFTIDGYSHIIGKSQKETALGKNSATLELKNRHKLE